MSFRYHSTRRLARRPSRLLSSALSRAVEQLESRRLLSGLGALSEDWGDAPDSYGTLSASGGPSHTATPNIRLGPTVDAESDGNPGPFANRDDLTGFGDDEDGILFTTPLIPGAIASIDVLNGGGAGKLNAWIDFNGNGTFDTAEQIATNLAMVAASVNTFLFTVPAGALVGPSYARFRLNEAGGVGPGGFGSFGEVEDYQVKIDDPTGGGGSDERFDYGDNPDSYRTKLISNGPRHKAVSELHLGPRVDIENDGFPSAAADGDDLNNIDDEDGVAFTSLINIGSTATVDLNNGGIATGLVNAWMDFNLDGDFADPGEQIFTNLVLPPGTFGHSYSVPASAVEGPSYARFRISYNGGLSYFGYGYEGEVEDYAVRIRRNPDTVLDYGDAPDSYGTLLASNGARHTPSTQYRLGGKVDAEPTGQPSPNADGDDLNTSADEDGIVFLDPLTPGATVRVQVTNGGTLPGRLDAWLDVLGNGNFTDAFDKIFNNVGVLPGTTTLTFVVPTFANIGQTYTRFRISPNGLASPVGFGFTGEVEDYLVRILQVQQQLDFGDAPEFAGAVGYPTTLGGAAGNPARHLISSAGPRLGTLIDAEADGQPNAAATGDDLANIDDEDGVTIGGIALNLVSFQRGATYVVTVTNGGGAGRLNAWFDWSQNVTWDPAEQVATNLPIAAGGTVSFTIVVPGTLAVNSPVYSRFRINTAGGLTPQGYAQDGEVEDYRNVINDAPVLTQLDYGDAPTRFPTAVGYPTLLAENGARHGREQGMPILGDLWDSEVDGQPTVTALGDDNSTTDDEDGVFDVAGNKLENTTFTSGRWNRVVVDVGGGSPGYVNAWVDRNLDGDWNDLGEQFVTDHLTTGLNTYAFFMPAGMLGDTYLRFRVSTVSGLGTTGLAKNGEVEDYRVKVVKDTVKPQVIRAEFEYKLRQAVKLFFSEPIDLASVTPNDLLVDNLTNGQSYVPLAVVANPGEDSLTWVFNSAGNFLKNGQYRFTLAADAVKDPSGNGNIGPFTYSNNTTFYLAGDTNHDRTVGFDDLLKLSQNYNTLGKDFSEGNLDYSLGGGVNFDDLLIMSQNYGTSLIVGGSGNSTRDRIVDDILA